MHPKLHGGEDPACDHSGAVTRISAVGRHPGPLYPGGSSPLSLWTEDDLVRNRSAALRYKKRVHSLMADFNTAIDPGTANIARVYDAALGGNNNYEVDRKLLAELLKFAPVYVETCRQSRAFLGRVVQDAVAAGIYQFLDIGSGLPTQSNVHEIAQREAPGSSRVVYVDRDPVVVAHTNRLLDGVDRTWVVQGDLHEPQKILGDPVVRQMLDWRQPVMVMLVAVLHFIDDDHDPRGIVRQLAAAAVPGSMVAIAHGTQEWLPDQVAASAQDLFLRRASAQITMRRREDVLGWLEGMQILDPGAVAVPAWRPARPQDAEGGERTGLFGVVAEVAPGPPAADAG